MLIWWVVVHVVGAVLGAGAATVNDVLFMRAIGSQTEGEAYRRYSQTLSLVAWIGVVLIAISAFAFWRIRPEFFLSQKVQLKLWLSVFVALNGIAMNIVLGSRVNAMKPADWQLANKLSWAMFPGAVLGGISAVTWYTLLLLGAVGRVDWTAMQILPWYGAALLGAWITGTLTVKYRLQSMK